MAWMETDYSTSYAFAMEDKMAAGAFGHAGSYKMTGDIEQSGHAQ